MSRATEAQEFAERMQRELEAARSPESRDTWHWRDPPPRETYGDVAKTPGRMLQLQNAFNLKFPFPFLQIDGEPVTLVEVGSASYWAA